MTQTAMHSTEELLQLYTSKQDSTVWGQHPHNLYEAVQHIMNIKGKRIRPLLVLLGCDLFNGNVEEALDAALAIEVFHNFTLVHDDIMDASVLRRGQPAVHTKYGTNTAILAGDTMLSLAYKYLLSIPPAVQQKVFATFSQMAVEIMEGQQMDINFETQDAVKEENYLQMIAYKTSVLIGAAFKIGAFIGGANNADADKMYQIGLNIGLAFQLKDDWLDAFGETAITGKKQGGDIIQNKKTLLYITAFNLADTAVKNRLLTLQNEKNEAMKIMETKAIFEAVGAKKYVEQKMFSFYQSSLALLETVEADSDKKEAVARFLSDIYNRQY